MSTNRYLDEFLRGGIPMTATPGHSLTTEQELQVRMLRSTFPFRLTWYAIHLETGEFRANATPTMAQANRLAREGWRVFRVQ